MRGIALAAAAIVVLLPIGKSSKRVEVDRENSEAEAVRLAVFQQQVPFWLDDQFRHARVVACLSIEEAGTMRGVASDYLRHFSGNAAVRVGDACEKRAEGAVERRTGLPAVLLTVGEISWQSNDEAWVTTRHYRTMLISGVRTQRVVREGDGWVCLGQIMKDQPL